MSVYARFRKETPFAVRDKAKEIEVTIIKTAMNEKYFPKRYRFTLAQQIVDDANKMVDSIVTANALPLNEENLSLRQRYQKAAYIKCEQLLRKFDLAERLSFQIPEGILEEIIGELIAEEKRITEWTKSDKERLKKKNQSDTRKTGTQ